MSTPTTLAQAIHARWSANSPLCALVPAERFCTGRVPASEEMPYVRLEITGGGELLRSRETLYEKRPIVFHVWTDTFDDGDAVAAAVRAAFAHAAFDWGTGGVLDCRPRGGPKLPPGRPRRVQGVGDRRGVCRADVGTEDGYVSNPDPVLTYPERS